jgi:hypothetical protein
LRSDGYGEATTHLDRLYNAPDRPTNGQTQFLMDDIAQLYLEWVFEGESPQWTARDARRRRMVKLRRRRLFAAARARSDAGSGDVYQFNSA